MNQHEIQLQSQRLEKAREMLSPGSDFEVAVMDKYKDRNVFINYGIIATAIDAHLRLAGKKLDAAKLCFESIRNKAVYDKLMGESKDALKKAYREGYRQVNIDQYLIEKPDVNGELSL